ncbi:hypothetical protein MTX78_25015 (plasmid) [Hymenobacter tibetensis]|uniref:ATP-binding protein n=1 Tax=Hymenobacter tibetensis TaxID=497967 RepID=A0ABY4D629_9BACT|nr:hypothetical protein [Hymenobacter tibetensis]UOG77627.1 hypothetical protein MTX78_25015 [Hymenobacter tibetensis]
MPNNKEKRRTPNKVTLAQPEIATALPEELTSYIEELAARRVGGIINLRGISFQLLYACERMLNLLLPGSPVAIQLEGLEDVDLHNVLVIGQSEYVQLKTSVNDLAAARFWEMGVLQNFLEVYKGVSTATFTLVHNMRLAPALQSLVQGEPAALAHWGAKLQAFDKTLSREQATVFLQRLRFEYITEAQLHERCVQALLANFDIHARSEEQYLKAVFYHAFDWSRQRVTVTYRHLAESIQRVKDSYSSAPLNEALRHNWLERVSYGGEVQRPAAAYFAGQAARPHHIADHLPVRRTSWESRIEAGLAAHAAVVVRSSSGQGKSTLAWQAGYAQQQRGGQVYEIRHCSQLEMANAIVEYLRAWVRVGEQPLVVIDGLGPQVSEWAAVVERVADLPVRFLITSRAEDWYRFGSTGAMLPVHIIDVTLARDEAERIHQELNRRGLLDTHTGHWQPAWEAVADRQLLIEYVYLLTQGQQLRERLAGQLRELNREPRNAAAMLEILRLVAVADCMAIQLDTAQLVRYVADTVGFDSDRGEVLQQLEREYFLCFGTHQVEGLHPVRSRHLAELLHQVLPLADTLAGVCQLLSSEQTHEFFAGLPGLLVATDRRQLYGQLAPLLANRTFLEMTAALDGLLCGEALHYWQQNQAVLDEVFAGGGLELFVYETIPFAKPDVLSSLSNIEGMGEGPRHLLERSHQLAPLAWTDSELLLFATLLHAQQPMTKTHPSCRGLGRLGDWLHRLDLPLPLLPECEETALLQALRTKPLAETQELFTYLWLANPAAGRDFTTQHRKLLLSYLKQHTDTPTLEEEDQDLVAEYLLDLSQGDQGNSLSVERLEVLATFLPEYAHYHSKAFLFPLRPAYLYSVALMNAEKRMTANTLLISRSARINRMWADTILHLYRAKSVYEWQHHLLSMRQLALELTKRMVRLLETMLEQQSGRAKTAYEAVRVQSELLEAHRQRRPKLPANTSDSMFGDYAAVERGVEQWMASVRNFVGQFNGLILPVNSNSRNLATYNLNNAVQQLPAMQAAQRAISARHDYFELAALEQEETGWYPRLLDSVRFYVHCQETLADARVYGVRERIRQWIDTDKQASLAAVHAILRASEQILNVYFHLPTYFIQEGALKTAVIGVEGVDFREQEQLFPLLVSLVELSETQADYFLLLPVVRWQATQGIRYNKAVLRWIKALNEGKEVDTPADWQLPQPKVPTASDVQPLPGVKVQEVKISGESERVTNTLQALWKIQQYRRRLADTPTSERAWLIQLETATRRNVEADLRWLKPRLSQANYATLAECATDCLSSEGCVDEDELVDLLEALLNASPAQETET